MEARHDQHGKKEIDGRQNFSFSIHSANKLIILVKGCGTWPEFKSLTLAIK